MAALFSDQAEVDRGFGWERVTVLDALQARDLTYRCHECGGEVRPHEEGTTKQRAHFEHTQRHTGCSLKRRVFSGTKSRHPHALD